MSKNGNDSNVKRRRLEVVPHNTGPTQRLDGVANQYSPGSTSGISSQAGESSHASDLRFQPAFEEAVALPSSSARFINTSTVVPHEARGVMHSRPFPEQTDVYQSGATHSHELQTANNSLGGSISAPEMNQTLNIECARDPHFGDTHIHTYGPVYTAPVVMKYSLICNQDAGSPQSVRQNTLIQSPAPYIDVGSVSASSPFATEQQRPVVQELPTLNEPLQPTSASKSQLEHDRVKEICENLQTELKKSVNTIANEESSLSEYTQRPLTPVKLSIVSQPQQLDDEFQAGHHMRRRDFVKMYERPEGNIAAKDMFARSRQKAEQEAENKFSTAQKEAKEKYINKHGNVVGVAGHAGIGKTVSSKKWALQALREQLCGKISFIFFIVVRFLDFKGTMTLLTFLLSTLLPNWTSTLNLFEAREVLNAIFNDPNVLVIVDGYDESDFERFSSPVHLPGLHSKERAEVFLKNLSGGNLLPNARKMFLSRPSQLYKLHASHRPKFIVQILGLSPQSQDELGLQLCGENYAPIREMLNEKRNVFAYCYVPVNFILTVNYLMNYDGDAKFVSLTRVLTFTCDQYSRTAHLNGGECQIDKLSKLAWDGFENKQVLFKLSDLINAGIRVCTADAFLHTTVTKKVNFNLTIMDGDKRIYFSHLIWQEFFAAIYLMMIMPLDEFKEKYRRLVDDRCEIVALFAFGICDNLVVTDIESNIPGCLRENWNAKKAMLCELISSLTKKRKLKIPKACSWAHETYDVEIAKSLAEALPESLSLFNLSLLPFDMENLSTVLLHRKGKMIKKLILSTNNIGDYGAKLLAPCISLVKDLEMCDCNIGFEGAKLIFEEIQALKNPMQNLGFSKNKIMDTGAKYLACCIHNVEELELRGCEITHVSMNALCDKIRVLKKQIRSLNLSLNKIGDLGAAALARCICNIQTVVLCDCEIDTEGVNALTFEIQNLEVPLKHLNISRNFISDKDVSTLTRCIRNIQELKVCECNLTSSGVEPLAQGIAELKQPMMNLNLSKNKFGDNGANFLSSCIYNLLILELWDCGITCVGIKALTAGIRHLKQPMKKLDLSWNTVGDVGCSSLASCIGNIAELVISRCDFGAKGLKILCNSIQTLQAPVEMLDVSQNNRITDEVTDAIIQCLHKLKVLDISWCGLSADGKVKIRANSEGIIYD